MSLFAGEPFHTEDKEIGEMGFPYLIPLDGWNPGDFEPLMRIEIDK